MIPSWRSFEIRSRSSTTAGAERSSRRAFVIAIPAWRANVSTRRWSPSLNSAAQLVREIQPPDGLAAIRDRDPEETGHRRMVRGEPVAAGIVLMSGTRYDRFSRMISRTCHGPPAGGRSPGASHRPCRCDETIDPPVVVDDRQGGVLGRTSGRTRSTISCRTSRPTPDRRCRERPRRARPGPRQGCVSQADPGRASVARIEHRPGRPAGRAERRGPGRPTPWLFGGPGRRPDLGRLSQGGHRPQGRSLRLARSPGASPTPARGR